MKRKAAFQRLARIMRDSLMNDCDIVCAGTGKVGEIVDDMDMSIRAGKKWKCDADR